MTAELDFIGLMIQPGIFSCRGNGPKTMQQCVMKMIFPETLFYTHLAQVIGTGHFNFRVPLADIWRIDADASCRNHCERGGGEGGVSFLDMGSVSIHHNVGNYSGGYYVVVSICARMSSNIQVCFVLLPLTPIIKPHNPYQHFYNSRKSQQLYSCILPITQTYADRQVLIANLPFQRNASASLLTFRKKT